MEGIKDLLSKLQNNLVNKRSPKSTTISIGLVVALVLSYYIYDKLAKPPRNLRHIPYINSFIYLKSLLKGESYNTISSKLGLPLLNLNKHHEMYMKKSLLGWTLQIANPKDAKQVFLKTDLFAKADMTKQKGTLRQDYLRSDNIVFTNEKLEWKKHRMLLNPAFHRSMPIELFADLTNRSFTIIDHHNAKPIDVSELFDKLTLDECIN
ncbi:unnamed protein product [Cunninghamella echinulata]